MKREWVDGREERGGRRGRTWSRRKQWKKNNSKNNPQRLNEICEKRRKEKNRNTHRKRGQ